MSIRAANATAVERLVGGQPFLIDCLPAGEAFGLPERTVLHSGPTLPWARACPTMQAAILCAIRYERWARDDGDALAQVERDEVSLAPCHQWGAVGPMTGMVTPSMPVFVVVN